MCRDPACIFFNLALYLSMSLSMAVPSLAPLAMALLMLLASSQLFTALTVSRAGRSKEGCCGCVVRNAVTFGTAGVEPGCVPFGRESGGPTRLTPIDLEVTVEATGRLSRISTAGKCDAPTHLPSPFSVVASLRALKYPVGDATRGNAGLEGSPRPTVEITVVVS
jgi:hypothetical protein